MKVSVARRIADMGTLRLMLLALALLNLVLMPFADASLPPEGWGMLFGVVLPAVAPIVVMVLMQDVLMCLVLKNDAEPARRSQLNFTLGVLLLFIVLLLSTWVPVFIRATYF
ncbi:MAG TPA: hypothetical protein VFX02_13995 [Gammaproteobacteria bacterium]|nr:hypothetical protein [Gammaproteobacteria bacterium]